MECISIETYQTQILPVLYASLNAARSPKTATDSSDANVGNSAKKSSTCSASFGRYEALLSSCKIWSEVCYLFQERIHVFQKLSLFMDDGPPFFFKKAAFAKFGKLLFSELWS
jgi:hypothetical protein